MVLCKILNLLTRPSVLIICWLALGRQEAQLSQLNSLDEGQIEISNFQLFRVYLNFEVTG